MPNEKNLIPNSERTPQERKQRASEMGIASGKARREKKEFQKLLEILLSMPMKSGKGADFEKIKNFADLKNQNINVQEAILIAQVQKAMKGDTRAAEMILDRAYGKAEAKVEVSTADGSVMDEVRRRMDGVTP